MNSDVLVGDRVNYPSYYQTSANFLIICLSLSSKQENYQGIVIRHFIQRKPSLEI